MSEEPLTTSLNGTHPTVERGVRRELSWRVASNLLLSFRYAWSGLVYGFHTQRNLRIHVAIGAMALGLSLLLQLSLVEIAVISLTIGLVLVMELINTALESAIDLTVKRTYHDLAKIAKDCAAAAVLVSSIVSLVVATVLLLPPLVQSVHSWLQTAGT